MTTPAGPLHAELLQSVAVMGRATPVSSITVTLSERLLVTRASPRRGITATPRGLVPVGTGAPTGPATPLNAVVRATSDAVLSPELVTTARSRSVSTATAMGDAPTGNCCTTVRSVALESRFVPPLGLLTVTMYRRADPSIVPGTVATSSRLLTNFTSAAGRAAASRSTWEEAVKPDPIIESVRFEDAVNVYCGLASRICRLR